MAGYSPLSYHCGSVWPHDTAIVVRGLSRAGQNARAASWPRSCCAPLARSVTGCRSCTPVTDRTTRRAGALPDVVPPAGVVGGGGGRLVQAFLGLTVDVPGRTITVHPPRPNPVGAIEVDGLVLPGGTLSVSIGRDGTVLAVDAPAGFEVLT